MAQRQFSKSAATSYGSYTQANMVSSHVGKPPIISSNQLADDASILTDEESLHSSIQFPALDLPTVIRASFRPAGFLPPSVLFDFWSESNGAHEDASKFIQPDDVSVANFQQVFLDAVHKALDTLVTSKDIKTVENTFDTKYKLIADSWDRMIKEFHLNNSTSKISPTDPAYCSLAASLVSKLISVDNIIQVMVSSFIVQPFQDSAGTADVVTVLTAEEEYLLSAAPIAPTLPACETVIKARQSGATPLSNA